MKATLQLRFFNKIQINALIWSSPLMHSHCLSHRVWIMLNCSLECIRLKNCPYSCWIANSYAQWFFTYLYSRRFLNCLQYCCSYWLIFSLLKYSYLISNNYLLFTATLSNTVSKIMRTYFILFLPLLSFLETKCLLVFL